MNGNPLWAVLAIAALSALGFGTLAGAALVAKLPVRWRHGVETALHVTYVLMWLALSYDALVERHRLGNWSFAIWLGLVALGATETIRKIVKTSALSDGARNEGNRA